MLDDKATGHFLLQMIQFVSEWEMTMLNTAQNVAGILSEKETQDLAFCFYLSCRCCSFIFQSAFVVISWACPVAEDKERQNQSDIE